MKKIMLIFVTFVTMLSAEGYVLGTGSKKGEYYKHGIRLATSTDVKINIAKSRGSLENLKKIMSGEFQMGFAQKDVYNWFRKKNPEVESKIDLLIDIREECVFAVARKDSKIDSDSDLQSDGVKIGVGKNGSGSQITWENMKMLEPGFKKAIASPFGGSRGLAKVQSGQLDALLFVMSPNLNNKMISRITHNAELRFIPITDWDLNDKLPSGKQVYNFKKVTVKHGTFMDDTVKTICTTESLFVSTDMDEDDVDEIIDAVMSKKKFIVNGNK